MCGSNDTKPWKQGGLKRKLEPDDFQITDSRYGLTLPLRRCRQCSFIFAEDAQTEVLVQLYEQLEDPSYEEGKEHRALQMERLIEVGIKARPEARSLLEIGAGAGLLLQAAHNRGLDAVGVEPSRSLVEAAKRLNGVDILQGIFPHPETAGRRFDLICAVDVIEHVNDPVGLLRDSARALEKGGAILLVTPDIESVAARRLGSRWWHLRLAHVGYFSDSSMRRAADAAGLRIVRRQRALWYFPVRYLAGRTERYLPVAPLNRLAEKIPPLRWIYDRTIPLNLRDSTVYLLAASGEERA